MRLERHSDRDIMRALSKSKIQNLSDYNGSILRTRLGAYIDRILYTRLYCRYTRECVKGAYEVPDYRNVIQMIPMHIIERALYEVENDLSGGVNVDNSRKVCAHPILLADPHQVLVGSLEELLQSKILQIQLARENRIEEH